MTPPKHPAPYSDPIMQRLDRLVRAESARLRRAGESGYLEVLDPMAGVGRIHRLHRPGYVETVGVELEPEWAATHEQTRVGSVLALPRRWGRRFGVVACSPPYGNRFADHHDAKDGSERHGYAFDLGRQLTGGSGAGLAWGPAYWHFIAASLRSLLVVTKPGGLLLWNVSDFQRSNAMVDAVAFHHGCAIGAGWEHGGKPVVVATKRMRHGANHDARASHEVILRFRRAA